MKSPITGKEMSVFYEMRNMTYRTESFPVFFHYFKCDESGEQFEDDHFSELNHNQVVNQYRVRHHYPFPEQIKEIRQKYNLSAARMSEILGLGANSWRNYEAGEMPSRANANFIQIISQPDIFEQHILQSNELDEKEREKIIRQIQKLKSDSCFHIDQFSRFQCQPDIDSGFKAFDRSKTKQVVVYFADLLQPFKTKMNKLLFYTDFVQFRDSSQSITGLKYAAITRGPVPNHYDILFDALEDEGIISKEYSVLSSGEVEQIISTGKLKFDESLFSVSELNSLRYIAEKFKETSAGDIAEISHQEPAWKENIEGKRIIPFHYAFGLVTV